MSHARKGLRLLSLSILLNIGWAIALVIITNIADRNIESIAKIIAYSALISAGVSILCFLIDLIGLHIAGKDNKYFHRASFLKILSILCGIACLVIGIIAAINANNKEMIKNLDFVTSVINIFVAVAEVIVLLSIITGCQDVAPRVKGLAVFVFICFIVEIAISIAVSFLANNAIIQPTDAITKIATVLGIVYVILAGIYSLSYILLIFRTTANIGKTR